MAFIREAAIALLGSALLAPAAAERHVLVETTLGFESTSVFRGYRAQRLNPNPYASLDFEYKAYYAGLYAAPVAFGAEENALLYGYAGYAPVLAGFEFDLGVGYYAFPDSHVYEFDVDGDGVVDHSGRKGLFEPYAGLARAFGGLEASAFVFYTPNSLGESGSAWYGRVEAEQALPEAFILAGSYAQSRFENDRLNADYDDWSVWLEKSVYGFDLKLRYSDTIGAPGPDNRTLALVVERPFAIFSSARADERRRDKLRNRWIVDKCRLGARR
jgi:uncharacterized protein (TIGR02001 family)